jgi:putative holliday junction resolvase
VFGACQYSQLLVASAGSEYKARRQPDNKDRPDPMANPGSKQSQGRILGPEDFLHALEPGARLFGLDVGTKTIGIALSDTTRMIASGLTTLARVKFATDAQRLLELADQHAIGGFVIGLPINLDGTTGPRAQATRAFARNLAQLTPRPILLWDERLTTQAAERMLLEADASRRRRAEVVDKVAATLILQGALDRLGLLAGRSPT